MARAKTINELAESNNIAPHKLVRLYNEYNNSNVNKHHYIDTKDEQLGLLRAYKNGNPTQEAIQVMPNDPLKDLISTAYDEGLVEHFNLKIDGLTINTLIGEMNDSQSDILKGFAAKLQSKVTELSRTNSPWL